MLKFIPEIIVVLQDFKRNKLKLGGELIAATLISAEVM